jgi:hypothetical protein
MTKRKQEYRPRGGGNNNRRGGFAADEVQPERPNLATINMDAGTGKAGFSVGDRVKIVGKGTYSGENVVIERLSPGVIPSAVVRTQSGGTRHVRTIDLVHAQPEGSPATD